MVLSGCGTFLNFYLVSKVRNIIFGTLFLPSPLLYIVGYHIAVFVQSPHITVNIVGYHIATCMISQVWR